MAPTTKAGKAASGKKGHREKVFHPESRKAGQLERKLLRKSKLEHAAVAKKSRQLEQVDRNVFFLHALPAEALALSIKEIHDIVQDVWLTRYDAPLEAEQAARRKGRPRSTKEDKLMNQKLRDEEEYKAGIEIPDLTYPPNVALFRQWNADDPAFLYRLRWIRISSARPEEAVISKLGDRKALENAAGLAGIPFEHYDDVPMELDDPSAEVVGGVDISTLSVDPAQPVSHSVVEDNLSRALDDLL